MRMSKLFGTTLREPPSEAEAASHQLLARAGFIRQLAPGIFSYLPLAQRSLAKIENILREEAGAMGGQELIMPAVQPAELWKPGGLGGRGARGAGRFTDGAGRDLIFGAGHEEVVAELVRHDVRSYRQLPALIYHLQAKWHDNQRPRGGPIGARETITFGSYSLNAGQEALDQQYSAQLDACYRSFGRLGLPVMAVAADAGTLDGSTAHEFSFLSPVGEDTTLICDRCGYAANRQVARFKRPIAAPEKPLPIAKVATPHAATIAALADYLGVPQARTAKAVFLMAEPADGGPEQFVFAVVRGDMEVNECKLANAVRARAFRPAHEDEILAVGAVPGYASPVGIKKGTVIVDEAIPPSPNLVAGANEEGYHLRNTNYPRDYAAAMVADIAAAQAGSPCPECGAPLRAEQSVSVASTCKMGTSFGEAFECTYLDPNGRPQPVALGTCTIDVGRVLACIAEAHHDEHGLIWPAPVAPYQVQLVLLGGGPGGGAIGRPEVEVVADTLYQELSQHGIEVLYDERQESPGVKFNDADLIGLPLRLTVAERALKRGGVELVRRREGRASATVVPLPEAIARVQAEIGVLEAEIAATGSGAQKTQP